MQSWFRGMWAVCCYEFKGLIKRPQEWIPCAVLPVFWCILMAMGFSKGILQQAPVGIVNEDAGPAARAFIMSLDAVPSIRIIGFDSRKEADASLRASKTYATIVFPKNFTKDTYKGQGSMEFELNKSYFSAAAMLEIDIKLALADFGRNAMAQKMTVVRGGSPNANKHYLREQKVDSFFLRNPAFNIGGYLLPTIVPGLLSLGAALTFSSLLVREWRDGGAFSLMQLGNGYATAVMIGKLLPWFLYYTLISILWVVYFAGWEGWTPEGSLFLWCAGTVLFVLAIFAIAVFFSSLAPTWILALSVTIGFFAPSCPFTGFSFPFDSMSDGMVWYGQFIPLTHYLALQGQCWVLDSPLSHSLLTMGKLSLFVIIPLACGLPIYLYRYRLGAALEEKILKVKADLHD